MAEYSNSLAQNVTQNGSVAFSETPIPCNCGFVRHRQGTGNFLLSGYVPGNNYRCRCNQKSANYFADFSANIAIPEGGTAGEISLAFALDGTVIPSSTMIVTPAAVGDFFNVSRAMNVEVWPNCCENLSIVNTSDQAITVQNANLVITRPDLNVTR